MKNPVEEVTKELQKDIDNEIEKLQGEKDGIEQKIYESEKERLKNQYKQKKNSLIDFSVFKNNKVLISIIPVFVLLLLFILSPVLTSSIVLLCTVTWMFINSVNRK